MPNGNIEKFRMEQRVGSLIFKHRGNIDKVVAECGADPDYVRTISERIQRKRKHEVNYDIACAISEEVLSGHQQETAHLIECLNDLTGYKDLVSPCCKVRMNRYIFDDECKYICSKCNIEIMNVIEKQKNYKEIRAIIAELRKEREFLTEFAAKMGFVVPKQDGCCPHKRQYPPARSQPRRSPLPRRRIRRKGSDGCCRILRNYGCAARGFREPLQSR